MLVEAKSLCVSQRRITGCIIGVLKDQSDFLHCKRVFKEHQCSGHAQGRVLLVSRAAWADIVPITQSVGHDAILRPALQVRQVTLHHAVVPLKHILVPVETIGRPLREDGC